MEPAKFGHNARGGHLHARQVFHFGYCLWILFAFLGQISADS